MKVNSLSFFLVIMLFCFNCQETDFKDNTRVLVMGSVVNETNTPIANAEVKVLSRSDGGNELIAGYGDTNANGNFEVTALFGNNQSYDVTVRKPDNYTSYRYFTNTETYTPSNLILNLNTVTLRQTAAFNYSIIKTSPNTETELHYTLTYTSPQCNETYVEGELDTNFPNCYVTRSFNGVLNENNPNIEDRTLTVPLNTEVSITYTINDAEPVTETSIVNQTNYEFNLNY